VLATVLIPAHSNGPTLRVAAESALAQTHSDLELLIVGDGIAPGGREAARELTRLDERVSFEDNPKGERHGEEHRHRALEQARGDVVFYLSDDDLWLPWHIEELLPVLDHADFAGGTVVRVRPGGVLDPLAHDLSLPRARQLFLDGRNRLPLSGAAHTLDAYRRRTRGWHPAPTNTPTDLYFFNGFLSDPAMTAASSERPSALSFPAGKERREMTAKERVAELESWLTRTRDQSDLAQLEAEIEAAWRRVAMEAGMRAQRLKTRLERVGGSGG